MNVMEWLAFLLFGLVLADTCSFLWGHKRSQDTEKWRRLALRRAAAEMWLADGGHVPYASGGLVHQFMVQDPDTRAHYERLATQANPQLGRGNALPL